MKWYWIVNCANTVEDPFVAEKSDFFGVTEWDLSVGRPIKDWNPSSWYRAVTPDHDGDPDDVLQECLDVPVYSARLRETLTREGITGIQYLPVRVFRPDGSEISGFSVANVLNYLPALDLERSAYERFGDDRPDRRGDLRDLTRPVLRAEPLKALDLVRLAEFKVDLYASERFKRVFEEGGFTGYKFNEIEVSDAPESDTRLRSVH